MKKSDDNGLDNSTDLNQIADDGIVPEEVVDLYYERLVRLARKKLAALPPQVADEEGAVVSALRSFFSGIEAGQFSSLNDENDLWRVLATITARKSVRQMRVHWKQSGEANHVIRMSDVQNVFAVEPSAEDEIVLMDQLEQLVENLDDEILKKIVGMRLEGYETHEIASQLGIHVRSVQRKIMMVKTKWLEGSIE